MTEGIDPGSAGIGTTGEIRTGPAPGRAATGSRRGGREAWYLGIALAVLLSGITVSIAAAATPSYTSSELPASGSFYALAEAGPTLFAASDNGGSILLERSTDQGASWSASPVPYSAVAGGAPWDYAVVAADGPDLVLAAATVGQETLSNVYPPSVPANSSFSSVELEATTNATCLGNSTVLLASSEDGGAAWNSQTFSTPGLSVTSLQANVVGDLAAVAWLAESTGCDTTALSAQAVTSTDAGASWSAVGSIAPANEAIPAGGGLEMAPGLNGLDLAFVGDPTNGTAPQLNVWNFTGSGAAGFVPMFGLVAPSSWTLQGQPGMEAFLLTPSYLIPLTSGSITALPFDQLSNDDSSLGSLPDVVSLVSVAPGTVAIAATTSDDLGVDCWQIELATDAISQTCSVSLGSFLSGVDDPLPIVALIDGGGWWTAIGSSSGSGCSGGVDCPASGPGLGTPNEGSSSAGGAAVPSPVGTSVCLTGCSSSGGLVSYSFTASSSADQGAFVALGALLALGGSAGLIAAILSYRRTRRSTWSPPAALTARARLARLYRLALFGWALAWSPLAILALVPGGADQTTLFLALVALGLLAGLAISAPFVTKVRERLADSIGFRAGDWMEGTLSARPGSPLDRMRWTVAFAYASWLTLGGLAVALLLYLAGLDTSAAPGAIAAPIVVLVLSFTLLRALYHRGLVGLIDAEASTGEVRPSLAHQMRLALGAALLPWNPAVGLFLGLALTGSGFGDPLLLAWAFLPVTLVGIAVAVGGFGAGRTTGAEDPGRAPAAAAG